MLREHLNDFADCHIDLFIIANKEIPLVPSWFAVYGIATYSLSA